MTIEELYEWAKDHNALDADIVIKDNFGDSTSYIEPTLIKHTCVDGSTYYEVEL